MDSEEVKPGFGKELSKEKYRSVFTDESGYPDLDESLYQLLQEVFSLFVKKQRDYGPGNINAFGEFGILVRTNDKIERLKNLYSKNSFTQNPGEKVNIPTSNESVDDTWMDIATYAMIALLVRRGQWPK